MKKVQHKFQKLHHYSGVTICSLLLLIGNGCKEQDSMTTSADAASSGLKTNSTNPYPKKPIAGELLFGTSEGAGSMGSVGAFETQLKNSGADSRFKFGAIRSFMKLQDTGIPSELVPYTPRQQGTNGRYYVPLISFRTKKPDGTHMLYPQIWNGSNDSYFLQQMADIAYYYGTYSNKVNGPDGLRAYPIILTFNHEFDLASESGNAYDPSVAWLSKGQQFAKAFRYIHQLFEANYPNMSAKWTWLPTAYSIRGQGKDAMFEYWPSRNVNPNSGLIDNGTPKLSDISYVDIMGCDAYMNENVTFSNAVNKDGITSNYSFLNMTKSVGDGSGMPWLLGEWGIDEKCTDINFKKNDYDNMMTLLSSSDATYNKCILISIWPTGSTANDNRWNSPPKNADGNCPYPWPSSQNSGISAQGFINYITLDKHMPSGRPNTLGL